ncbi:MAG: hypothetical protein A2040_03675 [Rhodocyclales bacterium GWA2_65_19]|nr:MAG: hypothetical protein A2040_03675 [Rhodocyclales bacterium GWA2_65_19]
MVRFFVCGQDRGAPLWIDWGGGFWPWTGAEDAMHNKRQGGQPATKNDLRAHETAARKDFKTLESVMRADVQSLRRDTDLGFTGVKADVRRLDAKIDSATSRLAKEIVKTQADVREIRETMATKNDVERILVAVQAFAGKAQVYDRAAVLHGHALTEAAVTLRDHEKRLRAIEARAA